MDPISKLVHRYPDLEQTREDITRAAEVLIQVYSEKGKVLVCGNGGSASDSEHIVGELMKAFALDRPVSAGFRHDLADKYPGEAGYLADHLQRALPAISLVSQSALISAYANDVAPDMVYAQQVYGYGQAGDALIALSTSGNSTNVINAVKIASVMGVRTIGMTNSDGGKLAPLCDVCIRVPRKDTPEVQELHLPIYHALCELLEEKFFGS
ncbi:MAG: SIS domain-containing protein [Anaerolineaceae bacterium]|nr:SIS domain-containing protein [Anaerolineaceae bacterium]